MTSDLRSAIRSLLKNPGFTIVALLTLAIGIGANTAIFSIVNGVLLRPLPFREPDRIVRVVTATSDEPRSNHSAGDFMDLRREQQSLQALAGYRSMLFTVSPRSGDPAPLAGAYVTAEFFDVLGVQAALGRAFTADPRRQAERAPRRPQPEGLAPDLRRSDRRGRRHAAHQRTAAHPCRCDAGAGGMAGWRRRVGPVRKGSAAVPARSAAGSS